MLLNEEYKGYELVQKPRQCTLKLALAFALKLQRKLETMDKELMHTFHFGKTVGWNNII